VPKANKKLVVYLLIFALPFALLFLDQEKVQPFKMQIVERTFSPIAVILFPFEEIKKIIFYHGTYNKYLKLKKETDILKGKLLSQNEIVRENARLKSLLDLKGTLSYPTIASRVVGRDLSHWNSIAIIDKGESDGLKPGMAVVSPLGVVGKIAEVGKKKSKVILISDPDFSVAAVIERTRETGLVTGTLRGLCQMQYLSLGADVKKGDRVVTASLSSSFPEGFLVGTVIDVDGDGDSSTTQCLIAPAVLPGRLEEVLIIKK